MVPIFPSKSKRVCIVGVRIQFYPDPVFNSVVYVSMSRVLNLCDWYVACASVSSSRVSGVGSASSLLFVPRCVCIMVCSSAVNVSISSILANRESRRVWA